MSNINWPDLVFYAGADNQPFTDVHVITLYAHCAGKALEEMVTEYSIEGKSVLDLDLSSPEVVDRYKQLLASIEAREYVEVFTDRVEVAVDAEWIDDFAVDRALEMLETVDEFTSGTYYEFGTNLSYQYRPVDNTPQVL